MTELALGSLVDLGKNAFLTSDVDASTGDTGNFTLSLWLYVNAIDEQATLIQKTAGDDLLYSLTLFEENNEHYLRLITGQSQALTLTAALPNPFNQWIQLAFTVSHSDRPTVCLFIDGNCVAQQALTEQWQDDEGRLQLGQGLDGSVYDVRRWQKTFNAEQISALSVLSITGTEPGLQSWFPLTEAVGLRDLVQQHYLAGTLHSWREQTQPYQPQHVNALYIDRAEEHVAVTGVNDFPQQRFTVECWYRSYHATSESVIIDYRNDAGLEGFSLVNPLALTINIAGATLATDVNLVTGHWTHIAVKWNKRDGKTSLFINGQQHGKQVRIPPTHDIPAAGTFRIGASSAQQAAGLASWLADVRLWSTGRSSHEITNNYLYRLEGDEFPLALYFPLGQQSGNLIETPIKEGLNGHLTGGRWETSSLMIQPSPAQQLRELRARAAMYQPPVDEEEPSKGEPVANVGLAFNTSDLINDFAEQLANVKTNGFALSDVKIEAAVLLSTEPDKVIVPYLSALTNLDPNHYSKLELNFTPDQPTSAVAQHVPNLMGNTQSFAQSQLVNAGIAFDVLNQATNNPNQHGVVIEQQPNPGESLDPSTPVLLVIGTYHNA